MVRILQLHFAPGKPTIGWKETLSNYLECVPEFDKKAFGKNIFKKAMDARYPADRKEYSEAHAAKCIEFVEAAIGVLQRNRLSTR